MQLPRAPDETDVETARGAVRDVLGSLRNLEQLLKSLRVGPRALAAVIPDVHSSCGPLLRHTRVLAAAVGTVKPSCKDAVIDYIQPRIDELERSLSKVRRGVLKASQRLTLEKVVTRIGRELHVALGLLDLLLDAREPATVPLDVAEMVRESASFFRFMASGLRSISTTLATPTPRIAVQVAPRITMALIGISVSLAVRDSAHVTIQPEAGGATLNIAEGAGDDGVEFTFIAPVAIEPTAGCAPILAEATSGRFERHDSGARIWLPGPQGMA